MWCKCCCILVCVANGLFDDGEERPQREIYVPPAPPEDEGSIFATLDAGINFDKYDEIPVEVTGRASTELQPIHSFDGANLSETLRDNVRKSSYMRPTPIQKYAIPIILAGRDVMACAQTGSGKTVSSSVPWGGSDCFYAVVLYCLYAEGVHFLCLRVHTYMTCCDCSSSLTGGAFVKQ